MPVTTRILVPTNFTPAAVQAVEHAAVLVEDRAASITLLHIINVNPPDVGRWAGPAEHLMARLREDAVRRMDRLMRFLAAHHIESRANILEGIPWEEIVEQSRTFDLLVLARETPKKFHLFSQDTVRRVLANSHCEVMLIPDLDGAPRSTIQQQTGGSPAKKAA
jgi:nucleotide-binding universal stress UspA family protein